MFESKNLNIFTPKVLAIVLIVFALLSVMGVSAFNNVWFTIGSLRFTAMSVLALVLAGAIMGDAYR